MRTWWLLALCVIASPAVVKGNPEITSRKPLDRTGQIIVVNKGIEQDALMFILIP